MRVKKIRKGSRAEARFSFLEKEAYNVGVILENVSMPHIHTKPGKIDMTVVIFIVHKPTKTVLLRYHDKYDMWLVPGGHIELDETPEQAAIRETKEEVGLDVKLFSERRHEDDINERFALVPPEYMDIHPISPEHRHISMVYFASSETQEIKEDEGREKSRGLRWMTKEEILELKELGEMIRFYALKALEKLS